jgi:CelD/BcsL family acetyltransferase involved in cellulose biosynthesis
VAGLSVEVLRDESDFDKLKPDWDELLDSSNQSVYFLRWDWNRIWWKVYKPADSHLYLIVCRNLSGEMVGLAPLYWRRTSGSVLPKLAELCFLGTGISITTSEHLDIITRYGFEKDVAEAIAAIILKDDKVDRLWLNEIPITSVTLPHLHRTIGQSRLSAKTRSYHVDTRVDWQSFKLSLGRSTRTKLDRCTNRLFKTFSCEFRSVGSSVELESATRSLVQLHQARWQLKGERGSFALPGVEELLSGAMRSSFADRRARVWTLTLNGHTAAVLLAFVSDGIAHYFQGGFDPEYAKYSLGTVMFGLCIRACIESSDIHTFDFMGGDDSYKEHWTKLGRDSVELEWLRPGIRSSFFRVFQQGERVGKSFLRMVIPEVIRAARRRRSKAVGSHVTAG